MTTEPTTPTPPRCAECGEPADIQYGNEGAVTWYCIRHVPPPPGLSESDQQDWKRCHSLVPFLRQHNRMPSLATAAERDFIISLIPEAKAGTRQFWKKYMELERWGKAFIRHHRFMKPWITGCNLLTLPIVLPLAAIHWLFVRTGVARRKPPEPGR